MDPTYELAYLIELRRLRVISLCCLVAGDLRGVRAWSIIGLVTLCGMLPMYDLR